MSNYTKSTDFASKDTLPSGDSAKIVRGTEIDAEFEALETAIASKANTSDVSSTYAPIDSPTFTGSPTAPTPTSGDNDTSIATTAFVSAITGTNGINGFKNRIINGSFYVDQRNSGSSQTITAAAALAYTVDRWYAYSTGANVTGQRIAGAYTSSQYRYQFTGASSVTAIGFGHRIEAGNSFDLANTTATLSCYISNSLLTTVTWTAYYASSTDSFGTLASPTRTQIATGTFTVSSTRTQYTANITVPSAATTGIEIVFTVGAQTSGTWIIDSVQLEKGNTATSFDYRPYGTELALCQRYYETSAVYVVANTAAYTPFVFPYTTKRAAPTVTASGMPSTVSGSNSGINNYSGFFNLSGTGSAIVTITVSAEL